jgi:hypothetical protein
MNALKLVHFFGMMCTALFSWLARCFLSLPVVGSRSRAALNTLGNFALYSLASMDESASLLNAGLHAVICVCEELLESTKVVEVECGGTSGTAVANDTNSSTSLGADEKKKSAYSSKLEDDAMAMQFCIDAAYVRGLLTSNDTMQLRGLKPKSRDELLLMHCAHGLNAIRFAGFAKEMLASSDEMRSS